MKRINLICFLLSTLALINISCKKGETNNNFSNNNEPPTAMAGEDQVITMPVDSVTLDGRASLDPDGTIISWRWTRIEGSFFAFQNDASAVSAVKQLVPGTYQFQLKVTDNGGLTDTDTIQITVNPHIQINPPEVSAGNDTTLRLPYNIAMLNGRLINYFNDYPRVKWRKISGPSTYRFSRSDIEPSSAVSDLTVGFYQFEISATDGLFQSGKDTMSINVLPEPNYTGSVQFGNLLWAIEPSPYDYGYFSIAIPNIYSHIPSNYNFLKVSVNYYNQPNDWRLAYQVPGPFSTERYRIENGNLIVYSYEWSLHQLTGTGVKIEW